jgi:hypothetical protein
MDNHSERKGGWMSGHGTVDIYSIQKTGIKMS